MTISTRLRLPVRACGVAKADQSPITFHDFRSPTPRTAATALQDLAMRQPPG
jgi:hypothetical protein